MKNTTANLPEMADGKAAGSWAFDLVILITGGLLMALAAFFHETHPAMAELSVWLFATGLFFWLIILFLRLLKEATVLYNLWFRNKNKRT